MVRLKPLGTCLVGLVLLATFHCSPASATVSTPRQRFARALVRVTQSLRASRDPEGVREGMRSRQVLSLLGPPDEIRPWDVEPLEGEKGDQPPVMWCYGVNAPGEFPTLGRVAIGSNDRVALVYGSFGSPPSLLPERELRRLLGLLDRLPGNWDAAQGQADPLVVIQAANALQRLGKDRALAVVDEFYRLSVFQLHPKDACSDIPFGLYPLLHTLFSVPADPELFILDSDTHLQNDIPLSLFSGGGGAPGVRVTQEDLANFKKFGTIRAKPLRPPDHPWTILTQLGASPLWQENAVNQESLRKVVVGQLLLLLRSVYRSPTNKDGIYVPHGRGFSEWWERVVGELDKLNIRWDPRKDTYVFADGTQLRPEHLARIAAQPGMRSVSPDMRPNNRCTPLCRRLVPLNESESCGGLAWC